MITSLGWLWIDTTELDKVSYQDAFKCQAFKGPLLSVNTHTYVSFKSNCNLDNLYITEQFSFHPSISKISFNIQHECCSAQDHQTPSNYDPIQSNIVSKCASNKLMDGRKKWDVFIAKSCQFWRSTKVIMEPWKYIYKKNQGKKIL